MPCFNQLLDLVVGNVALKVPELKLTANRPKQQLHIY
jgi:hypothetical protein